MKLQFNCEVTEVKAKKTASNDREISIRLVTDDIIALQLQEAISNYTVRINIENEQRS